jgi:prepilin-type N-terminal cleavage/methylation domain-containing protein
MKRGFTLIELMIAIAIVAILLLLVIGAVKHENRTWERHTVCNYENTEVFNEVTKGSPKRVGENYWEVDGKLIYAGACTYTQKETTTVTIK